MDSPLVSISDVTVAFRDAKTGGERIAIEDLNLGIAAESDGGAFHVIVGPSGCGKTTTLNLIAGLVFPSSGSVAVHGRPVRGPGRDRGFVFQSYSSFPHLTVLDNVAFGLKLQGVGKRERHERARHFVEQVGLQDHVDSYPDALSGGMRQRVALARTLAVEPEVVLFDEPLGALDAQTKVWMYELINRMWLQTSATFVYVTHDLQEALFLGTDLHLFSSAPGRIVHSERIGFERPRHTDLMTSPEFNRLLATVLDRLREATTRQDDPYPSKRELPPNSKAIVEESKAIVAEKLA